MPTHGKDQYDENQGPGGVHQSSEWETLSGSYLFNIILPTGWHPASRGATIGKSLRDYQGLLLSRY